MGQNWDDGSGAVAARATKNPDLGLVALRLPGKRCGRQWLTSSQVPIERQGEMLVVGRQPRHGAGDHLGELRDLGWVVWAI